MIIKRFSTLLLSLICFISVNLSAQISPGLTQTIRGTVFDGASNYSLESANVILSTNEEIETFTDSLGKFTLRNVPIGRHTIEVYLEGYETSIFKEVLVTSSKEITLQIPMKESINGLEGVTVSATKYINKDETLNKMALTGGRMLSVEEASRYAGGMDDPARLVSSFSGVAPSVSNNGISVHGNAPHLLQWRLEDIEIPNPNHFADLATLGGGVLSSLSSNVLGNSDFFTGAFPSEYANAVSGVFDMKLRDGNKEKMENTVQLGILGIDVASEGPLSKAHKASYIFNYRYSTTSLLKMDEKLDYQDLNFKLNFPTKKAGTFSLWGTSLIDGFETKKPTKRVDKWEVNNDRGFSEADQYMAAAGVSHIFFLKKNTHIKTTLATTYFKHKAESKIYDLSLNSTPFLNLNSKSTNLVLNSYINHKFNSKLTNKTGFTVTKMYYNMNFDLAPFETKPLEKISEGKGNTELISAYTSSSWGINDDLTFNFGLNGQVLTLNNKWTLEPRAAIKWEPGSRNSFAFAYGMHSRMEKMDVYFVKTPKTGNELVNKNLDFTKAHHFIATYSRKISNDMTLKIEPYFQFLYDIPVIVDSSYSVLNRQDFYVEDALVNKGKGRNYGIDITLEKFLTNGYYYMFTGSVFDSKYKAGDNKWRNTRFNRNFIVNALVGKEWMFGKDNQNVLSASLKLTLQGGDRYSPIDEAATMNHPDKEVQYDENKAYSKQFSPIFLINYSVSYRMNRNRVSHEFAVKSLNAGKYREYIGHDYNFKKGIIEKAKADTNIINVSYKLEF